MPTRPPDQVAVGQFRQILVWPLLLKDTNAPAAGHAPQFDRWVRALGTAGWQHRPTLPAGVVPALADPASPHANEPAYEEVVYFHPYVRDLLYGDGDAGQDRTLVRLTRADVRAADVTVRPGETPVRLTVSRVELYLCKPLVALLVVEVAAPDAARLTLAGVMELQSTVRQAFPPYFGPGDAPGNCPHRVAWLAADGSGLAASDFDKGRDHFARFTADGAEPPVAAHWGWLVRPLAPFPGNLPADKLRALQPDGLFYQQAEDDRVPSMTFLAVDDPRAISEGDYDRLVFADTAGPAVAPYSDDFLDGTRADHRYDRYWRRATDHDTPDRRWDTRYLCSGYQFVVVGRADDWFFDTLIRHHFRTMYFRLGLLAHYHKAALLKFADDLAEAVKLLEGEEPERELAHPAFRKRVTYLQMTFLKFRTRSWFPEVSNQLQGRELFAWWAGRLGTADLFRQVDDACQRLYAAVSDYEARGLTRSQKTLAEAATVGLPVSIGVSIAAALLSGLGLTTQNWDGFKQAAWLTAAVGAAGGVLGLGFYLLRRLRGR